MVKRLQHVVKMLLNGEERGRPVLRQHTHSAAAQSASVVGDVVEVTMESASNARGEVGVTPGNEALPHVLSLVGVALQHALTINLPVDVHNNSLPKAEFEVSTDEYECEKDNHFEFVTRFIYDI